MPIKYTVTFGVLCFFSAFTGGRDVQIQVFSDQANIYKKNCTVARKRPQYVTNYYNPSWTVFRLIQYL